ncbi:hypothetical protein T492DRAFT_848204 [Pavlovales sp. CCMP2436]|nr:hypothetical protein T492DRAFT_848204 [Pavlovales sp. CCMP2436]
MSETQHGSAGDGRPPKRRRDANGQAARKEEGEGRGEVEDVLGYRLVADTDGVAHELAEVMRAGSRQSKVEPIAELRHSAAAALKESLRADAVRALDPATVSRELDPLEAMPAPVPDGHARVSMRKAALATAGVLGACAPMCAYCGALRSSPCEEEESQRPCTNRNCSSVWSKKSRALGGRLVRVWEGEARGGWEWGRILGPAQCAQQSGKEAGSGSPALWLAIELHGGRDGASSEVGTVDLFGFGARVIHVALPSKRVQLLPELLTAPSPPSTHVFTVLQHVPSGVVSVRSTSVANTVAGSAIRWPQHAWRFVDFVSEKCGYEQVFFSLFSQ